MAALTSYRGAEAIDCVGMQPIAEPDLGLCDNLKPNRFLGTERKRFNGTLCMQGPLLSTKGDFIHMNILQRSALSWKVLTEYRYIFTYGYKKNLYPINLTFSLEDYPHLAGFQYLKDISHPNYTSARIVDRIIEGKILFEKVEKAQFYEEMVKPRLEALVHLKNSLDNEFVLYSYMPRMYPFVTSIKADYFITSHINITSYVFIIQAASNGNAKCDFVCCSAFEQGERDYETNQRVRTLLKKERIHIATNTSTIFFDKIKPKNEKDIS